MPERSSTRRRPRDLNQLAAAIVAESTEEEPRLEEKPEKNPAAVALGRLGGRKGGKVTQGKLTPEERREKARKAAAARWHG